MAERLAGLGRRRRWQHHRAAGEAKQTEELGPHGEPRLSADQGRADETSLEQDAMNHTRIWCGLGIGSSQNEPAGMTGHDGSGPSQVT
jgi:hypothetical protein